MQSFEELTIELKARQEQLKKTKNFIAKKKEEFEKAIEKPTQFVEREEREIKALLNSKLPISLQTYVEELAKIWDTDVKNLNAQLIFDTFDEKMTKQELIREMLETHIYSGKPKYSVAFLVDYKDGPITHHACIKRPITERLLSSIQKDGKSFVSHLQPEIDKIDEDNYESTLKCDDYRYLAFDFSFGEIARVMTDSDCQVTASIAVLNAAKRNNQYNKQEETRL